MLIADLISINLPPDTHLLAYTDDLQLISTGRNRFVHAQLALDEGTSYETQHPKSMALHLTQQDRVGHLAQMFRCFY